MTLFWLEQQMRELEVKDALSRKFDENNLYEPLECCRCIAHAEWHTHELMQTLMGNKGRLDT